MCGVDEQGADPEHVPGEGPRDHLLGEGLGRRAERNHALVQAEHQVKVAAGALQVVGGDQDRPAAVAPALEESLHRRVGRGIQPREGLVEQQDLCVLSRGLGEESPLALPPGEIPEAPLGEMLDPQLGEGAVDQLAVVVAEAFEPAEIAVATHPHHVCDRYGEGGLELQPLRDESDPAAGEADRPGLSPGQADRRAEQGGLAGTVRPQQRHRGPGGDLEADVEQRRLASVADREPPRLRPQGLPPQPPSITSGSSGGSRRG